MRRGLSLGGQTSIDAPVSRGTRAPGQASERRPLRWDDWAEVTPAPAEDEPSADARLRPDALRLMVAVGAAGVVSAQAAVQVIAVPSTHSGPVLVLLQASGPVTVALLSAFLLHACDHLRGRPAARFWITAVAASTLTYVAWSAVYFVAAGGWRTGLVAAGETFARDLSTGSASPHLALVLAAVQLCAVLPVVRRLTRATRGAHLRVLAVSAILQLAVSATLHWVWPVSYAAGLLPGYVLFVVAGALWVEHQDEALGWAGRHPALVGAGAVAGVVVAEAGYGLDLLLGISPERRIQTVAPAVAAAGVAALVALVAAGAGWRRRHHHPRWQRRLLSAGSDAVTGVYLASPLLVQAGVALLSLGGSDHGSASTPPAVTIVLGVAFGLPVLLASSWVLTAGLRQGPLSAVLTARRRLPPARRGGTAERIWNAGAGVAGLVIVLAVAVVLPPFQPASSGARPAAAAGPAETTTALSPAAPGTTATMHAITVGGLRRRYEVIVPQRPAARRLPVIVFLHGDNAGLTDEMSRDGLLPLASAGQVNLVYPVGFDGSWNDGTCCSVARRHGVDDVAFLTDVVHASRKIQDADPALVYLAGYAGGGKMVDYLMCQAPRLAGGAVVIAAAPPRSCASGSPIPFLRATGDKPAGSSYQRVVQEVHGWAKRDRCTGSTRTDQYNALTLERWSTCAEGSRVELATYAGGGNSPFGGDGTPTLARVMLSFVAGSPFTG